MASGMKIGGTAILAPMDEEGSYYFDPGQVIARNGAGAAIVAPYASILWRFDFLTLAKLQWWTTTLLAGAAYKEYTSAELFNNAGVLTTFTHCVVLRPTYSRFQDGLAWDVSVVIDQIL